MKAIFNTFSLVSVLLAAFAGGARAQDTDAPVVHVHFRTLGVLEPDGGDLYYSTDQKDVAIKADENVRSDFYDYKGPAVVGFYHLKTNPDKTVEHVSVADVDLTGKGDWPLLLVTRGGVAGAAQHILAVPDDLVAFPPSSYRFINRSKSPCSCVLGTDKFVLAPDETKLLKPSLADPAHRAIPVQVTGGAPVRLIYTSNWALLAGPRTMVFINEGAGDFGVARRIVEGPEVLATEMKKVSHP